jgi:hypothetical protein
MHERIRASSEVPVGGHIAAVLARRRKQAVSVLIAIAIAGAASLLAVIPSHAGAAVSSCSDIYFLGARGSGEWGPGSDDRKKGVWTPATAERGDPHGFGREVNQIWTTLGSTLPATSIEPSSVPYAAESTDLLKPTKRGVVFNVQQFLSSITNGLDVAYTQLINREATCPNERIVLAGYSQGAMVMHRLLQRLADEGRSSILRRVRGVGLVADGDRVRGSRAAIIGDPAAPVSGTGIAPYFQLGPQRDIIPDALQSTVQLCSQYDVVCDYSNVVRYQLATYIHTTYSDTLLDRVAQELAKKATGQRPELIHVSASAIGRVATITFRARNVLDAPSYPPQAGSVAYFCYDRTDLGVWTGSVSTVFWNEHLVAGSPVDGTWQLNWDFDTISSGVWGHCIPHDIGLIGTDGITVVNYGEASLADYPASFDIPKQ